MRSLALGLSALSVICIGTTSCVHKKPLPAVTVESVVVRHFDNDLSDRFSFPRTIGQILKSANIPDTPTNRRDFVQTMITSFSENSFTNLLSGMQMPVTPRSGDAALIATEMLNPQHANGMIPIGLFNRIDLAPADWSDCGEHRIVYALKSGAAGGRFFLIFEAKLPNPKPQQGKKGCRAVAERWAQIGNSAPAARNDLLDKFYYTGLPGFSPVVSFENYGSFLGQVRSNSFRSGPWQLREFRVLPVPPGALAFLPGPVASNPFHRYYANNPQGGALEQSERGAFHAAFAGTSPNHIDQLRNPDATVSASASQSEFQEVLFSTLGAAFHPRFNEFQSMAQGSETPADVAGSAIQNAIPPVWSAPLGTRAIERAELLNRAGAITCGGCHQLSNGREIGAFDGTKIRWPQSAGFVHISELKDASGGHIISDALSLHFIPFRQKATVSLLQVAALAPGYESPTRLAARPWLAHFKNASFQQQRTVTESDPLVTARRRQALVDTAKRLLASGSQDRKAFADFEVQAERARAEDQLKPGAFMPFRRPH